jgi:hypothetical protein
MSKLHWINCSRIREYEPSYVIHVKCMYCKCEVHKSDAWRAFVRGKVKLVWCTTCISNSEANNKPKKAAAVSKKQMQLNQLSLFNEEGK